MSKKVPDFTLESSAWSDDSFFIGLDEAGYGTAAGSMWIAATIWPKHSQLTKELCQIRDSKQTTAEERELLADLIKQSCAWFLWEVTADQINNGNPYWLRYTVPESDLLKMPSAVTCFDGNRSLTCPQHKNLCQVKGDQVSISIAAASILAKYAKDLECKELHKKYPNYNLDKNSGYLTKEHIEALKALGPAPIHRVKYVSNILKP